MFLISFTFFSKYPEIRFFFALKIKVFSMSTNVHTHIHFYNTSPLFFQEFQQDHATPLPAPGKSYKVTNTCHVAGTHQFRKAVVWGWNNKWTQVWVGTNKTSSQVKEGITNSPCEGGASCQALIFQTSLPIQD